jgi:hypothetical protein
MHNVLTVKVGDGWNNLVMKRKKNYNSEFHLQWRPVTMLAQRLPLGPSPNPSLLGLKIHQICPIALKRYLPFCIGVTHLENLQWGSAEHPQRCTGIHVASSSLSSEREAFYVSFDLLLIGFSPLSMTHCGWLVYYITPGNTLFSFSQRLEPPSRAG